MKSLVDLISEERPKLTVLNRAPNGAGKTTLGLTFPDPIYVYDFDGRIKGGLATALQRKKRVYYDTFLPTDPTALKRANEQTDQFIRDCQKPDWMFNGGTIMIDTITSLAECGMLDSLGPSKDFYQVKRARVGKVEVPVQSDYQVQAAVVKDIIEKVLLLGKYCHIVANAHEYEKKDKQGALLEIMIHAPGQMRTILPGKFDEYWWMRIEKTTVPRADGRPGAEQRDVYQLMTRSDNLRSGRSCYSDALSPIETPDFDIIYGKITKWIAEKRKELGVS